MSNDLLTVTEAARRLGLDPSRLRRHIYAGHIAAIMPGHEHLIDAAELARFAAQPRRAGRPAKTAPSQPPE